MFCPKCKSEYLDGVETCPDCEEQLIADLVEVEEECEETGYEKFEGDVEFVKILQTFSPNDIIKLKIMLDAAGITYFIQGENMLHVRQCVEPAILLVEKSQESETRELLKDMNIGYFIVASVKTKDEEDT